MALDGCVVWARRSAQGCSYCAFQNPLGVMRRTARFASENSSF